jgi:hypothetical protein
VAISLNLNADRDPGMHHWTLYINVYRECY